MRKLHLKVNETKSAVASVFGRKFLGYSFWVAQGGVIKRKVADKPLKTFKQRIRQLTCRVGGRSMPEVVANACASYVLGWKAYFRLAQTPRVLRKLDEWLRHRLRAIQLKQWKRGTTDVPGIAGSWGPSPTVARQVAANSPSLVAQQRPAPQRRADDRLLRPSRSAPPLLTSTSRTARCGPACRVVWQGSGRNGRPLCRLFGTGGSCRSKTAP